MPAKSVAQRRLFAIAEHDPAYLKGNKYRSLKALPRKTLHDFAATSEKHLPEHVKRSK